VVHDSLSKHKVAPFHYSFFGLRLRSNLRLFRLPLAEDPSGQSDCELHLNAAPELEAASSRDALTYTSSFTDRSGEPALRIWQINEGAYSRLDYSDGHQFWLDRKGTHVWATCPDSSSLEELTQYLLGPVLGVALRYRGVVCLHASAVSINNRAIAFLGPPGAGKSTMAAALAQRGYRVLADDITAIQERNGTIHAQPAYPGVSLWPGSIDLLYGRAASEAPPSASGDKQCVSTEEGLRFEARSLPLSRVYILGYRDSHDPASIIATSPQNLFLSLVANTYASNILDTRMRAHEFGVLGRIASEVRGRTVDARRNPSQLGECCNLIAEEAVLG